MFETVGARLRLVTHGALVAFEGRGAGAEAGQGLEIFDIETVGVGDENLFRRVAESYADLGDSFVEGPGGRVGPEEKLDLIARGDGVRGDPDLVIGRRLDDAERSGGRRGRARGDEGGRGRRFLEACEIQVVGERVTRLLSLKNPDPGAHVQAADGRGDLVLVEGDAVADGVFEVHLGEFPAPAERCFQQLRQIVFRDGESGRRLDLPQRIGLGENELLPEGKGNDQRSRAKSLAQECPPVHEFRRLADVHEAS